MKLHLPLASMVRGAVVFLFLTSFVAAANAARFTVTTAAAGGPGSLRQAILDANASPGADVIEFNLPGSGAQTILVGAALPAITDPLTIDGTTQPGYTNTPLIELNGNIGNYDGLFISAGNCAIKALAIWRFGDASRPHSGVVLTDEGNNVVQGCFLGLRADGVTAARNSLAGILITNSANNVIGGTTPAARNVISSNTKHGVRVTGAGATNNLIAGNFIGVNATGLAALSNQGNGIEITNAPNNTVGGALAGNVVAGFDNEQIRIIGPGASGNTVSGNLIGLKADGTALTASPPFGNGIRIDNAPANLIGGTNAAARNVIANNNWGVLIIGTSANNNLVQGNFVGTTASGTAAAANQIGVRVTGGATGNVIGGTDAGARNVISGNRTDGVNIADTSGNFVLGNFIGTDFTGTNALGNSLTNNQAAGVTIAGILSATTGNMIGGTNAAARNVISGNNYNGITLVGALVKNTVIQGNFIGLAADGATPLGNYNDGIEVLGAVNTLIGTQTTATLAGLKRSGRPRATMNLQPRSLTSAPAPALPGGANFICYNGANGVECRATFGDFGLASSGTQIFQNAINKNHGNGIREFNPCEARANVCFGNTGINIDHAGNGPDSDPKSYVHITKATSDGQTIQIEGFCPAALGQTCVVDLFASNAAHPSGQGECQYYLGSVSGIAVASARVQPGASLQSITPQQDFGFSRSVTLTQGVNNIEVVTGVAFVGGETEEPVSTVPITIATAGNPDLQITKTVSPQTVVGTQPVTFTITVKNIGTATAKDVSVFDTLPPDWNYIESSPPGAYIGPIPVVSISARVQWGLGDMAAGASQTVTLTAAPSASASAADDVVEFQPTVDAGGALKFNATKTFSLGSTGNVVSPLINPFTAISLNADFDGSGGVNDTVVIDRARGTLTTLLDVGSPSSKVASLYLNNLSANTTVLPTSATTFTDAKTGLTDIAITDIATPANGNAVGQILIGINDGTGNFSDLLPAAFRQFVATGSTSPFNLISGDFNNDNKDDLAFVDRQSNQAGITLNDGANDFPTTTFFATGGFDPVAAVTLDVNGDHNLDLVVASQGTSASQPNQPLVTVLLGDGKGHLAPASGQLPVPGIALDLVGGLSWPDAAGKRTVVDFNNDGFPDFAVASTRGVLSAAGTFQIVPTITLFINRASSPGNFDVQSIDLSGALNTSPQISIQALDINSDGKMDLAVRGQNSINFLLNTTPANGPLAFSQKTVDLSGASFLSAAGDFTGDGVPDLVVAGTRTTVFDTEDDGLGVVVSGVPAQNPSVPATFKIPRIITSLAASDLNGDGKPDLVAATLKTDDGSLHPQIQILLNNSTTPGNFSVTQTIPTTGDAIEAGQGVIAFDAAGGAPGAPDILVATQNAAAGTGQIEKYKNDGKGSFVKDSAFAFKLREDKARILVARANGDLVALNQRSGTISSYLANGTGGYAAPKDSLVGENPVTMTIVNADGDTNPDLAVALGASAKNPSGALVILQSFSDGTFGLPQTIPAAVLGVDLSNPSQIAAARFDPGAKVDAIVIANESSADALPQVSVLENSTPTGSGIFNFTLGPTFSGNGFAVTGPDASGVNQLVVAGARGWNFNTAAVTTSSTDANLQNNFATAVVQVNPPPPAILGLNATQGAIGAPVGLNMVANDDQFVAKANGDTLLPVRDASLFAQFTPSKVGVFILGHNPTISVTTRGGTATSMVNYTVQPEFLNPVVAADGRTIDFAATAAEGEYDVQVTDTVASWGNSFSAKVVGRPKPNNLSFIFDLQTGDVTSPNGPGSRLPLTGKDFFRLIVKPNSPPGPAR